MRCQPDCACGRHRRRKCMDGCTCYRHPEGRPYARAQDYANNHRTVREVRGRAPEHRCATCCSTAEHWAKIHGTDGTDPAGHYMPMCISCHHAYDETHKRAGMRGKRHTEESRRRMSESRKGKSWLRTATPEKRAEFGAAVSRGKAKT